MGLTIKYFHLLKFVYDILIILIIFYIINNMIFVIVSQFILKKVLI